MRFRCVSFNRRLPFVPLLGALRERALPQPLNATATKWQLSQVAVTSAVTPSGPLTVSGHICRLTERTDVQRRDFP